MARAQTDSVKQGPQDDETNHWDEVARKSWRKEHNPRKITSDFVKKELWNPLEKEGFDPVALHQLENLQLLESLWQAYTDTSTNYHVLLITFLVITKSKETLPVWDTFGNNPELFASLFRRILSLSLAISLSTSVRTYILSFLIVAFQSLDNGLVRKECAPLVSISIWHNLGNEDSREAQFQESNQARKAWRASAKRYEAAEEDQKAKLRFERSWLFTLLIDFVSRLQQSQNGW